MLTGRSSARSATTRVAALATCIVLTCLSTAGLATADPPDPSTAPPTESSVPTSDPAPPDTGPPASESSAPPTESSPPAPPERPGNAERAERAELEVTADFDKPSYRTGELVKIKFRIKNVGSTPAVGLQVAQFFTRPDALQTLRPPGFGDLDRRPGPTLAPGATLEVSVSGHMGNPDVDTVALAGFVYDHTGIGQGEFAFTAPVIKRLGHAGGIVFGDANHNGKFDAGEGLPGATLTWANQYFHNNRYTATTDAAGRFTFTDIPTVPFSASGEAPNGWLIGFQRIEIDESDKNDNLRIRAVQSIKGKLRAGLEFTRDSYQAREVAHVRVTLTNTGSSPLVGIVANCNRAGFGHGLEGSGPGWGALAPGSEGVTIGAGQTKTFDVSEKVPDVAIDTGYVFVACGFGFPGVEDPDTPSGFDTAKVPGGIASLTGDILFFPNGPGNPGQGVAGVKLVLVDDRPCPVVGETTTDGSGHFEFHNLAPGPDYQLYVLPPQGWKVKHENPTPPDIRGNSENRVIVEVERGTGPLPTVPTNPSTCTAPPTTTTPAPQARSTSGLASTGASVLGLTALGAIVVLLGVGIVVTSRRRRRPTS